MTGTVDGERALQPLTGFTVGVTAARRREELATLLERRGARVVVAPAIRIVPLQDDGELRAATEACLSGPLDLTVVTTGIGFRGWVEAADGWGRGDALRAHLGASRLVARGPKARGAIRAAGLGEEWSPESEAMGEVLRHLLAQDLRGARVAVQLHGEPLPDLVESLEAAGAEVVTVPVYGWTLPEDVAPLRRLVRQAAAGRLDALTFTSAPAVTSTLRIAQEEGVEGQLLAALTGEVLVACVGPVCAAPLDRRGVPSLVPDRARLGNLVRALTDALPERRAPALGVAGHLVEVRGHAAVVDGTVVPLPPGPMAMLRALAASPGRVLTRRQLCAHLPGQGDEHAVEVAVARLRTLLGAPEVVQTVIRRGYRLPVDAAPTGA